MDKYSNLANVIHVYNLIDKLKPSDRYYQGNLEAAKLAVLGAYQHENIDQPKVKLAQKYA